jgi:DTW domain-containing protein YfiP
LTSKRKICLRCQRPEQTCLCAYLAPFSHKTNIHIIQLKNEGKNAKNTAKLLPLMSEKVVIYQENEVTPEYILALDSPALLFPSQNSIALRGSTEVNQQLIVKNLIVIDGTWRKAKAYLHTQAWLNKLTHVQLSNDYSSQYDIRSTTIDNGLSTLEAVAYALSESQYEELRVDTQPLFDALNGLNKTFMKMMPDEVKTRYE